MPTRIDNKVFLTFEDKSKYILESSEDGDMYAETYNTISNMLSRNDKKLSLMSYMNKLRFLTSIKSNVIYGGVASGSRADLSMKFTQYFLQRKQELLKNELAEIFDIDYDNIPFEELNNRTYMILNKTRTEVRPYEGHIYAIYYKNYILDNIDIIINLLGKSFERG